MKRTSLDALGKNVVQGVLPLLFPIALLASVFLTDWSIPVVLTASLTLMGVCQFFLKLVEKTKHPNWYGFLTMFVFWGIITIGGMQIHKAVLDSREANKKPAFVTELNGLILNDVISSNVIEVTQQDGKYILHITVWNNGDAMAENVFETVLFPSWMDATFPAGWIQGGAEYGPGLGLGDPGFKAFVSSEAVASIIHPHTGNSFNMIVSSTNQPPASPFLIKLSIHSKGAEHIRVVPVRLLPLKEGGVNP